MRRSRFNEEQIIAVLKEAEAGTAPDDVCRGAESRGAAVPLEGEVRGQEVSEARRLRQLEEENRRAEAARRRTAAGRAILQAMVKKGGRPACEAGGGNHGLGGLTVSERRAGGLVELAIGDLSLSKAEGRTIRGSAGAAAGVGAARDVRYGYRRLKVLLRGKDAR